MGNKKVHTILLGLFFIIVLLSLYTGCKFFWPQVYVSIINESTQEVTELNTRIVGTDEWNNNILSENLPINESVTVYLDRENYEFQVIFADSSLSKTISADLSALELFDLIIKEQENE
jgi:hypothetical protein